MKATHLWYDNSLVEIDPDAEGFADAASDREESCGYTALRHTIGLTQTVDTSIFGLTDPETEKALVKGVDVSGEITSWKCGMLYETANSNVQVTVLDCENDNFNYGFVMKGNILNVLEQCSKIHIDGKIEQLSPSAKEELLKECTNLEQANKKVFGFADRSMVHEIPWEEFRVYIPNHIPTNEWRFIGFVAIEQT